MSKGPRTAIFVNRPSGPWVKAQNRFHQVRRSTSADSQYHFAPSPAISLVMVAPGGGAPTEIAAALGIALPRAVASGFLGFVNGGVVTVAVVGAGWCGRAFRYVVSRSGRRHGSTIPFSLDLDEGDGALRAGFDSGTRDRVSANFPRSVGRDGMAMSGARDGRLAQPGEHCQLARRSAPAAPFHDRAYHDRGGSHTAPRIVGAVVAAVRKTRPSSRRALAYPKPQMAPDDSESTRAWQAR